MSSELRDARARMGVSLAEASKRTRIPERYFAALEKGDHSVFPAGPFLSGYTRQYRAWLGLGEAPALAAEVPETTLTMTSTTAAVIRRQGRARLAALAAMVVVAGGLGIGVWRQSRAPEIPEVGVPADQTVLVHVVEPVKARVVADGRVVFAGNLTPGPQHPFEAHDRLELDLATLDAVGIVYNGRSLKPLGAQSRSRRLVFIDGKPGE